MSEPQDPSVEALQRDLAAFAQPEPAVPAVVPTGRTIPTKGELLDHFVSNLFLLPFRVIWDLIVIVGSILLEIAWVSFLFGSVVGVVLLLIFAPGWFVAPLGLLAFVVHPWPEYSDNK